MTSLGDMTISEDICSNFHCNYITTLKAKYFNGCLVIISTLVVVDHCFMGWD